VRAERVYDNYPAHGLSEQRARTTPSSWSESGSNSSFANELDDHRANEQNRDAGLNTRVTSGTTEQGRTICKPQWQTKPSRRLRAAENKDSMTVIIIVTAVSAGKPSDVTNLDRGVAAKPCSGCQSIHNNVTPHRAWAGQCLSATSPHTVRGQGNAYQHNVTPHRAWAGQCLSTQRHPTPCVGRAMYKQHNNNNSNDDNSSCGSNISDSSISDSSISDNINFLEAARAEEEGGV